MLVVGNIIRLLQAVGAFFGNEEDIFSESMRCLKQLLMTEEVTDETQWKNFENEVTSLPLAVMVPNYQEVASTLVTSCRLCSDEIKSSPVRNMAFRNGELFIIGGLLQTFLLAPQGPVDPAKKRQFQLTYAEQEVRKNLKRFCKRLIILEVYAIIDVYPFLLSGRIEKRITLLFVLLIFSLCTYGITSRTCSWTK